MRVVEGLTKGRGHGAGPQDPAHDSRSNEQLWAAGALPVGELHGVGPRPQTPLARHEHDVRSPRLVIRRLGENLDVPRWNVLPVRIPRAVAVDVERGPRRAGLDLQPRWNGLQLEEQGLRLGDVHLDDARLALVVPFGDVDSVTAARDGEVVWRLPGSHHGPGVTLAGDPDGHVVGNGVDGQRAAALLDAFDSIAGQGHELAVRALADVGVVVCARVLEPAEEILALGHHEHGGGARFDFVGARELDEGLFVLTGVEQPEPYFVMGARLGCGVLRGKQRRNAANADAGEGEGARQDCGRDRGPADHLSG